MASEIERQAHLLVECIKREGTCNIQKQLILDDRSSRAVSQLLKFLAKDVSVYSTDHEIKLAPHVF